MARDVIIHQINDWSVLNSRDEVWSKVDLSTPELNFGIHKFQGRLWSSGYVGVDRRIPGGSGSKEGCRRRHHPAKNTLL